MRPEHWIAVLVAAAFAALLTLIASLYRPDGRAQAALARALSGAAALFACALVMPQMGVNVLTVTTAALLGAPGALALLLIAR